MRADRRTGGPAVGSTNESPPGRSPVPLPIREQLEFAADLRSGGPAVPRPLLDQRQRGTSFIAHPVKSVLNSPATTGMGFWSVNPYVGCEFGCTYCYARETHKWAMERSQSHVQLPIDDSRLPIDLPPDQQSAIANRQFSSPHWEEAFEKQILVKQGAAAVLARTLDPGKIAGASIVIGTATDPYQPAERKFRLTRQLLEALLPYRGLSIGLITKSPLVARDLDVLKRLAARHEVSVNISLATTDPRLARRLELRSPAPHARLRALETLTKGGIHAGLLVAPILPGITDSRASLAALMAAGKAAGARYVVGMALRLGPVARHRFLPHLAREFPELVERYQHRYGHRQSAGWDYTSALSRRLQQLQREYGFPVAENRRRQQQLKGQLPRAEAGEDQRVLL